MTERPPSDAATTLIALQVQLVHTQEKLADTVLITDLDHAKYAEIQDLMGRIMKRIHVLTLELLK